MSTEFEQARSKRLAQLRSAMAPSLCRCGTHMRILRAVRRAAVMRCGGVVEPAEPVT